MKFLSRVVWHEGMHLGPHHFQMQSRYFEDSLWFLNSSLNCAPFGFLHLEVDQEELRNGKAVLNHASGIMPDGLIFDTPDSDEAPAPAQLNQLFTPMQSNLVLHLAVPRHRDEGGNYNLAEDGTSRYRAIEREFRDDTHGIGEFRVSLAQKNLLLRGESETAENMVSMPVARILRDGGGGFACDPAFIPPALRIGASESLLSLLRQLEISLDEKIAVTRSGRLAMGRFELGTSALDVANYWFLHSLCSALPALRHHLKERRSHPEAVYLDLCRLAGALSTFSLEGTLDEIPAYVHTDLTSTFRQLAAVIRGYLDVVAPSNSVTLQFRSTDPYFYAAEVKDERCLRRSRWIFGIRSNIAESALLSQTPRLVKVCSALGVRRLVERALPSMALLHLPVPPSALHAQADMHYFSISLDGPCWEHILQTRQVGVYLPAELGSAVFDVSIILENPS
jgi:type VI secretion system protein ImpJ